MDGDLQTIRDDVAEAKLPEDVRKTVLWCLDRLPKLYQSLAETCDSRHSDEVLRVIQMLLRLLAEAPGGPQLSESIAGQLRAMHERLGMPGVNFKPPAKRAGRGKAG